MYTSRSFRTILVLAAALLVLGSAVPAHAWTGHIIEFPLPTASSFPFGATAGPDGNLWFTEDYRIGRITPSGVITEFPLRRAIGASNITAGPDGNLWFTEAWVDKIGRITPAGTIREFPLPTAGSYPFGIAAGPDGNLWFAEAMARIGRITPSGVITEFPVPWSADGYSGFSIAAGPDGNLWFTEAAGKIGRITPSGVITEFPLPTVGSWADRITAGPDGNLWFTEAFGNKIGRITPSGVITEFPLPAVGYPVAIAAGPDGNVWFTEEVGNNIGRITPTGTITLFAVPTWTGPAGAIAAGPDGNLWFTEEVGNKIGRVWAAVPWTAYELSMASGLSPKVRWAVRQGANVQWIFLGPTSHSVTDASGMGLFDSGVRSFVTYYTFRFTSAGAYPYRCDLHPLHRGQIRVPVKVAPPSGSISSMFTVTWAVAGAPAGYVFDVQIERPGSSAFVDWQTGVSALEGTFVPDVGAGTYTFRARLRNTANGRASWWSPARSIAAS